MCPPDLAGSSLTKTFFFSWQDFGFPWVTLLNLCPICALCPKPSPVPDALVWMSVSAALSPFHRRGSRQPLHSSLGSHDVGREHFRPELSFRGGSMWLPEA